MKNPNGFGSVVHLKGNRRKPYQVRVTKGWTLTDNGKQKQIIDILGYFATRKEGMLALLEYHKNPYDLTSKTITFSEIYEKWSQHHFEKYPSSKGGLVSAYKKCEPLYNMKMNEIRKAHMQDVVNAYSHQSIESQTKIKTVFLNTFKYALENDIVEKDYSQFVTLNEPKAKTKKEKYFTDNEIEKVFNNLDFVVDYPIAHRKHATLNLTDTVLIMLYTGLRIMELLNLKIEDVNLKERYINVNGTKTENAQRVVPIHKDLIPILENLVANNQTHLVEIAPGKAIKEASQYRRYFFELYMKHLDITHTPHALRHTFISIMDRCGVSANSVTLKRIVGHSNSNVTESYTHKNLNDLIEAIDKLEIKNLLTK